LAKGRVRKREKIVVIMIRYRIIKQNNDKKKFRRENMERKKIRET
jgi:hypothetical protein